MGWQAAGGHAPRPTRASAQATRTMNLRVADIQACYEEWSAKGAAFVTLPIDRLLRSAAPCETPMAT